MSTCSTYLLISAAATFCMIRTHREKNNGDIYFVSTLVFKMWNIRIMFIIHIRCTSSKFDVGKMLFIIIIVVVVVIMFLYYIIIVKVEMTFVNLPSCIAYILKMTQYKNK